MTLHSLHIILRGIVSSGTHSCRLHFTQQLKKVQVVDSVTVNVTGAVSLCHSKCQVLAVSHLETGVSHLAQSDFFETYLHSCRQSPSLDPIPSETSVHHCCHHLHSDLSQNSSQYAQLP